MNANQLWMRRVSVKYGNAVTLVISLKGRFKMSAGQPNQQDQRRWPGEGLPPLTAP